MLKAKDGPKTVDADSVNNHSWKQEDVTKMIEAELSKTSS